MKKIFHKGLTQTELYHRIDGQRLEKSGRVVAVHMLLI